MLYLKLTNHLTGVDPCPSWRYSRRVLTGDVSSVPTRLPLIGCSIGVTCRRGTSSNYRDRPRDNVYCVNASHGVERHTGQKIPGPTQFQDCVEMVT